MVEKQTVMQWYLITFKMAGITKRLHCGENEDEIRKLYNNMGQEYIIEALTFERIIELLGVGQGESDNTKKAVNTAIYVKGKSEDFMVVVF